MTGEITLGSVGGEYMETAVLLEWRVGDGARVAAGDVVAVVETAKAATDIEAPEAGVLRILVPAGDEVAVGTVLARVGEAGAGPAAPSADRDDVARGPTGPRAAIPGIPRRWPEAYASPLAKRLAAARGIDLSRVRGTGPAGRIVRADLPDTAITPAGPVFHLAIDVDMGALRAVRAARWETGDRPGIGAIVADTARQVLTEAGHRWPVALDDDAPPADALAVLDLATFGVAAFTPPPLPCRAVVGLALPDAATLRVSLVADTRTFACTDAARFLALLRTALENLADA